MLSRSLLYFWAEALKSIIRHGWMSIASIAVVAVTLLILGSFMVINFNLANITQEVKEQVQIVLYLEEDVQADIKEELERKLFSHEQLEEIRFVSREDAMDRLRTQLDEHSYLLEGYQEDGENPLRPSFELSTRIPEDVGIVAQEVEEYPGVAYADYGSGVVEPLFQFTGVVRWVGLAFMAGLAVTAVFLIAHTIRLTVYIRREEIMIMKYVGATNWFIRWPFIFEGLLLGLLGGIIPIVIIYYGYHGAFEWMHDNIYFITLLDPGDIITTVVKVLIPLGLILGALGSVISLRRFLKV